MFWSVFPSEKTGNDRQIELAGLDLALVARIENVFVYPNAIDVEKFQKALSQTLSLFPIVAGHFYSTEEKRFFIEMSNNSIPVTFVENSELTRWPTDLNVVIDLNQNILIPFIDEIQVNKFILASEHEPLLRLKLTRIVNSGEWVLGASWAHLLGDADAFLKFLNCFSRLYQQLEPLKPEPTFDRRLWKENEMDVSLLSSLKHFRDAQPMMSVMEVFLGNQAKYEQVNICFSGEQLKQLYNIVNQPEITLHDSLLAYLIVTLNKYCFNDDKNRFIQRANIIFNYRGVSDSIAMKGQISNNILPILTDDFEDPLSLSNVAIKIRQTIVKSRDPKVLERRVATVDGLMKKLNRENLLPSLNPYPNEVVFNSNYRYDWADLVDFGFTDQCRFYTAWTDFLYFRIFRRNPMINDNSLFVRDSHGAEVAFRIEKEKKQTFLTCLKNDFEQNFASVNK